VMCNVTHLLHHQAIQ